MFEDLGVQMNRHSTLVSYLEKLVWLLTGNFGKPGAQYVAVEHRRRSCGRAGTSSTARRAGAARSPARGSSAGSMPCNVIAEEILTDHPDRYRAMIVESRQPGPLARRQRSACARRSSALDLRRRASTSFMTETARLRRLRAAGADAVREVRGDVLQLRVPAQRLPPAPPGRSSRRTGPLPEPEIHARLVEALGAARPTPTSRRCARRPSSGRAEFAAAFVAATAAEPALGAVAPVAALPHARPDAARRRGRGRRAVGAGASAARSSTPTASRRAGFGDGPDAGERLFDAILDSPSGVVFTDDDWDDDVAADHDRRTASSTSAIPELLAELAALADEAPPGDDAEWPFLLSAGERRSFTANTIFRDPAWRKRDADGALRVAPADAARARPRRRRPGRR